jgi:hypothetical protein
VAKTQYDPITPDEYVLRRILNKFDRYDPSLAIPVQRYAFAPNEKDRDGLSVFRELFVTPEGVARTGPNSAGYYVARLAVSELLKLGLTVVPDPLEDAPPGHAMVPELSFAAVRNAKTTSKEIQFQLAMLASTAIVYEPGKFPTSPT